MSSISKRLTIGPCGIALLVASIGAGCAPSRPPDTNPCTTRACATDSGGASSGGSGTSTASGTAGMGSSASGTGGTTGGAAASSGSGGSTAAPYQEAPHLPFATIPDNGGPKIANPRIVAVTFQGDAWAATDQAWASWVVGSAWLQAVGSDYGVGAGTYTGDLSLVATSTLSDDNPDPQVVTGAAGDLRTLLEGLFSDGTLPAPTAGDGSIYLFFVPAGTSFSLFGSPSCTTAAGYHYWYAHGSVPVTYAVVFDCGGANGRADPQAIEDDAAHELMEAATDPLPDVGFGGQPGFSINPLSDPSERYNPWGSFGGEVGDLCQLSSGDYLDPASGFHAQRIWSNSAAQAATTSPCAPIPPGELFYSMSGETETILASPGMSLGFLLTGWATSPTGDWCVVAVPESLIIAAPPGTFDPSEGQVTAMSNNGQPWTLQLSVPADAGPPPPDDAGNVAINLGTEWVASTDCNGGVISLWPLQLGIPPVGQACAPPVGGAQDPCAQLGLECTAGGSSGATCQLPGELAPCLQTVGCRSPDQCLAFDAGTTASTACAQPCQQTSGCLDPVTSCQSVDGQEVCNANACTNWDLVCDAEGTGDGSCIPYANSAGQTAGGVCLQAGPVALGGVCALDGNRTDSSGLCAAGTDCLGTAGATTGNCYALCDPLDASACPPTAPTCTALGGGSAPDFGYCHS